MDEDDRPVTRETTVINAGGGRGGGGAIAALAVLIVIAIALFLFFGGYLERAADKTDINLNVAVPKVELPDVHIDTAPAPARSEPAANQSGK